MNKNEILEIINCSCPEHERFNKLFSAYQKLEGKSSSLERKYNRFGYTPGNYENLVYESKKLVGITDLEVATFEGGCGGCGKAKVVTMAPLTNENPAFTREELVAKYKELYDKLPNARSMDKTILAKILEKEKDFGSVVEAKTEEGSNSEESQNTESSPADETPKSFREDYPFLNDPNCPEEYKILAADKITAYNIVKEGTEKLQAAKDGNSDLTEEELAVVAKQVADADFLNDQIHIEFGHYKNTGEVFGEHPIFKERNLKKKVDIMTGEDKVKRIKALDTGIRRDKTAIKDAKNDAAKLAAENRLAEKELELQLIKKSM